MKAARLPEALQNWVSSWYSEVRYFVKHLGWEKCVHASQGVRQGCLLAPLLWSLCTGYLLVSLQQVVSPEWVAQSITGYADDFHASDRVKSYQDLENAEYRFGSLLDVLADANMCINQKKSAILLRVRGSFAQRWLRHHQLKRDTGPHLRIRTPKGRQYEFPLKEHHVYLGVKISYYSSAKHTVAHRIQAANHTWQRLRRILCSRTQLDVWKRLAIWKATVIPTLMYGLAAAAPGLKDISRMQHQLTRQARAITHLFAHLSKVSTQELHRRFRLSTVLDMLHKEAHALRHQLLINENFGSTFTDDHLASARDTAATLQAWQLQQWNSFQSTASSPSVEAPFQCHRCGKAYSTYRLLRVHESVEHSQKAPKTDEVLFDRALHSLNGLPTCRLCHHVFRQWDNLKQHIRRKRCPCSRGCPTSVPRTETDREIQPAMVSDETAASLPTPDVAAPEAATVLTPLPSHTDLPVASTSVPSSPLFPSFNNRRRCSSCKLVDGSSWRAIRAFSNICSITVLSATSGALMQLA